MGYVYTTNMPTAVCDDNCYSFPIVVLCLTTNVCALPFGVRMTSVVHESQ